MDRLNQLLKEQSQEKNVWNLSEQRSLELLEVVKIDLFETSKNLEKEILNSFKTTSFMVKQGHHTFPEAGYEFINYFLGGLFDSDSEEFLRIRKQVHSRYPFISEYNLKTLDMSIVEKYFPNIQAEYDFVLGKTKGRS